MCICLCTRVHACATFDLVSVWAHQHTLLSSIHRVECLSSAGWDSSHFHGCDRSKHQSVTRPRELWFTPLCCVTQSLLLCLLRSFAHSQCPPRTLSLPFDPLPTWPRSPNGQLWARMQHFYIATVCGHTPWGIHTQKWQTDGCASASHCILFQTQWSVGFFNTLTPYIVDRYWITKGPKSIRHRYNSVSENGSRHTPTVALGEWRIDSSMRWHPSDCSNNEEMYELPRPAEVWHKNWAQSGPS